MGIFQQFPYSNFHEMNLDQIIKIMREMQDEWTNTKTEWASYKEFIDNYFENLDLDEETEKALRVLVADGTLDPVIDPVIIAAVTEWLDDHITQPTIPVIDTSLSIAGAAADAKITGDELNAIKNDINTIVIRSSNRLNMDAVTADWIDANGTVAASVNYHATDFIPVTAGETIYFWCEQSPDNWAAFDTRQLVAYDALKQAVAASAATWATSYTVPNGIAFVRLNIANSYLNDWTNFYVGSLQVTDHDEYLPYNAIKELVNQSQVDENTANIAQNTANIEHITEPSSNLLDMTKLIPKFIAADGSINDATLYHATDYLPVSEGESIYAWGKSNGQYTTALYRFVCAYDENKIAVPSAGYDSAVTPPYVVPNGIKYIRVTLYNTELNTYENMYVGTHPIGVDYEDFGLIVKIPSSGETSHTVHNGGSILEEVKYCYANDIKNLVVEAGTYDIIDEYKDYYGSDYYDNYIDYAQGDIFDAGIWLQNINVKFEVGSKVICKYTGANTNVYDYFAAFATGNNVTIDGLVLDAENLRYAIHADFNSGSTETFFTVKNCDLKNVRADGNKCIGAGLGKHVFWMFENNIFRTTGNYYAMRIHNSADSDAESKIVVKDCYIDGDGFFMFSAYSTSTKQTIIQVCGNSYKTAPVVNRETPDSNDNFTMIAWNNELRS